MKKLISSLIFLALAVSAFAQPTITDVLVPQLWNQHQPTAFRVTISGLTPNASYNAAFGMLNQPDITDGGYWGFGYFYCPELNTGGALMPAPILNNHPFKPGDYVSFTADADGSSSLWVTVIAQTELAEFDPVNYYPPDSYLRLAVSLNDGNGGSTFAVPIVSQNTLLVSDIDGTNNVYNYNASTEDDCGLLKVASNAPAGKFVFLWDNETGRGQPVAGYMVEDNGIAENTATDIIGSTLSGDSPPDISSYYLDNINGQAGSFLLPFPIGSSNGVRRIAIYNADGSLYAAATSPDGIWNGIDSKGMTVGEVRTLDLTDSPLPVELNSFSARSDKDRVMLNWQTQTEVNAYVFQIERRTTGDWIKIGEVKAHGNSNSPKDYSFSDKPSGLSGTIHYRLKMVDNDGSYKYSEERTVEVALPSSLALSQNYPNPFNPATIISYSLPAASWVSLRIYDLLGREVATLIDGNQTAGAHQKNFNGSKLPTGIYIYKLDAGGNTLSMKMLLLK